MPLPTYDLLIDPLLRILATKSEPARVGEVRDELAAQLGISPAAREIMLPSGRVRMYDNRVGWAHDRLKRAGLSASAKRGHWQITPAGSAFVEAHPLPLSADEITEIARVPQDSRLVRPEVPGTDDAHQGEGVDRAPTGQPDAAGAASPQEVMEAAFAELQDQVAADLLEQVRSVDPMFFERLVLDVLHAMGYGVARDDLRQVGQSGDGGIDGVVNLDKLGLQKVYVQAKRWQDGNSVGRPDIQAFYGALAERRATYGVFITTSGFSRPALGAAKSLSDTIVLVDGEKLVRLMMEYGIGVSTVQVFNVKRLDTDYFADE